MTDFKINRCVKSSQKKDAQKLFIKEIQHFIILKKNWPEEYTFITKKVNISQ
jgi:t-SNARE complex subunit (syntaxin)